ncbi:MAG: hypothetical protein Ct9H300mP25_16380 [Acidobacteriota bacterium]|nr:MAG: hypothetical protein Ct9H300mP25_16380 [Acidobacteriota bacterium]
MLSTLLSGVYVVVCLLLLVVVLLQQGKGGDIAAAFGGSGSQAAFGARKRSDSPHPATTILGTLFMVGALFWRLLASVVLGPLSPALMPLSPVLSSKPFRLANHQSKLRNSVPKPNEPRHSPGSRKWRNWQTH